MKWLYLLLLVIFIPILAFAPKTENVVIHQIDCEFDEAEFLNLVNGARTQTIAIDYDLDRIAQQRAESLEELDNHVGFRQLMADKAFPFRFTYLGENLASNSCPDDKIIFDQFMSSPGHKATMLDSRYDYIGIGFYKNVVVTIYGDL
jgi:uncharacterized protein YkwD